MDDAALAVQQIERFAAMRKPAPVVHLASAPTNPPSARGKTRLGGVEWILKRDGSSEWAVRSHCVFEGAEHSVHNTRTEAFTDAMVALAMDGG